MPQAVRRAIAPVVLALALAGALAGAAASGSSGTIHHRADAPNVYYHT